MEDAESFIVTGQTVEVEIRGPDGEIKYQEKRYHGNSN